MTGATSRRISDIITDIDEKKLKLRPPFQRRLVWTNVVKDNFLETVLLGLPFPEIFIGAGEVDTSTRKRTNWLVDGQQRVTTLREYVDGSSDLVLKKVKPYAELTEKEKQNFLDYLVAVRDLGTVTKDEIIEIFQRINSTDYALKHIERLNALFTGAYNKFCDELSRGPFFDRHDVFSLTDRRRMRDLDFCVILVTTLLSTYYHRSELNKEYLERYNDKFPKAASIKNRLTAVFDFIERCDFEDDSRAWRKTDLFTLLVELDAALHTRKVAVTPTQLAPRLKQFYKEVNDLYDLTGGDEEKVSSVDTDIFKYLKAATKATNDGYARSNRAEVLARVLEGAVTESIGHSSKKRAKISKRKPS